MTVLAAIDPFARGGTVMLLVLWTAVLWRDHRATAAARVAMAMNLSIIAFVLNGALNIAVPFSTAAVATDILSVLSPPLFWLFARLWFDDRARAGWRSWAVISLFALLPTAQIGLIATTGRASILIWTIVRCLMLGFGVSGIWIAWRGRDNDLIETRRAFRLAVAWTIGGFGLLVNVQEAMILLGRWPHFGRTLTEVAIALVTLLVSVGLYQMRAADLFAAPVAAPAPVVAARAAPPSRLLARLERVMTHDRAYRAEGFTIAALAALLEEPEYRVRRAINGELGFRNFTAFLNSYRLAEVRDALADPTQREVSILTIAIDAGFGSLGPFNRAFREAQGMTPSEYRRSGLADSGIG